MPEIFYQTYFTALRHTCIEIYAAPLGRAARRGVRGQEHELPSALRRPTHTPRRALCAFGL